MARRLLDADNRRELRRQIILQDRLEARFRGRIASVLASLMTEAAEQYSFTGEPPTLRDADERISAVYREIATAAVIVFGGRIIEQGKAAGLILETKGFAETLALLAQRYIGLEAVRRRIVSVAETTRSQIINAISAGFDEGLGVAAIARRIREQAPQISRTRAAIIARTETHGAANYGANAAAQETGLPLRKEWVSAEDARTRPEHAEAGRVYAVGGSIGPIPENEPFIVGGEALMYPGDPGGSAANVIACRCAVAHVVDL